MIKRLPLEAYRHDLVDRPLTLETFCDALMEDEFETPEAALEWFDNQFTPAFMAALQSTFKGGEGK